MLAVSSVLNRPYRFASFEEESIARKIVTHSTQISFVPETDSLYFSNGQKTPQAVKRNIQLLENLGLGEHSTIRQFIKASIAKAKSIK